MPVGDYSDAFKAEALAALNANGGNVMRTANELDIPRKTLEGWRDGVGTRALSADDRHQKRGDLADRLEVIAWKLVDGIEEADISKASLVQKTTAFGILCDKMRLLRGEATSIHEDRKVEEIRGRLESKLLAATSNGEA